MKKTIIICDDDEGILEVVKIVLEEKGFNVISLLTPERIYSVIEDVKPDLILLDLWLPVINGDTIAYTLKKQDKTKNIPIVLVSANKDTSVIAKKIGADGFICKPFDITELESVADRYTQ